MKVSGLPIANAPDGTEQIVIVQGSGAAEEPKLMPASDLAQAGTRPTPDELDAAVARTVGASDGSGAGLVGFLQTATYAAGSVGATLKALLSSAGSAAIGFIQSGAGAVARFVQDKLRERISVKDFGAVGDGVADDSAAFLAALAALHAARTRPNFGYGSGSAELFIPSGKYYLGTATLDITHTMRVRGEGTGGGGGATVLVWDAGTTGIRVQSFNTTGATGVIVPAPADSTSGQGALIEGLLLKGTYAGVESEAHAIHLRANATIRDCQIYDFAGDGIHSAASAGSGGATEGNDNTCRIDNVLIQNCRNGIFFDGADTNACTIYAANVISNRQFGIWDSSFLGNTHIGHQASGNGTVAGTHPASWVSYSGNRYVVKRGQEVGASTNAPSGTTADNAWWYYFSAGAADAGVNCPAWTNGATYRAGGSYCTDDTGNAGNLFSGCYHEGSQPFAQFVTPTLVSGGSMAPNVKGVACLKGGTDISSDQGFVGQGNLQMFGNNHGLGRAGGPVSDTVLLCNSTNSFMVMFARYDANGALLAYDGQIIGAPGGLRYYVTNYHQFYTTAGRTLYFDSNGLNLDDGKNITIAGVQVVGARQTGTPADATDLASALALVNALKAKLIAHGLIS